MGELAQLSGRPSLIDASAIGVIETLLIPPQRLRDLLVEEAELGERIMRALILRRVGLLETGAGGPVIVGGAANCRCAAARRISCPQRASAPAPGPETTDPCAQALIERFHIKPSELPIVLCPSGELLRNPSEDRLAALASDWSGRSIRTRSMTWSSSAPARRASPLRSTPPPRVFPCWCWIVALSAARLVSPRASRRLVFPIRDHGPGCMARRLQPGAEIRRRDGSSSKKSCARPQWPDLGTPPARNPRCNSMPPSARARWSSRQARADRRPEHSETLARNSKELENMFHDRALLLEAQLSANEEVALVGAGKFRRPGCCVSCRAKWRRFG